MIIQAKKKTQKKNNKNVKYLNKDITKMKFVKSDLIIAIHHNLLIQNIDKKLLTRFTN